MTSNDSYPTSDSELIITNLEPECTSKGKTNHDYINDWVNDVTVKNIIWRGIKLREQKPLPDKTEHEYDVINVNFLGSFSKEIQCRERRNHPKSKFKTSPSTLRSTPPYPIPTSASTAYSPRNRFLRTSTPRIKTKNQKRCSMRIAELAVPTKRQCIDTWRNKSYILPEFMVQRLKQHVMDQRPIVKIPEAINCFQRRRRQSSKKSCHIKKKIYYEVLKPIRQIDTRTLCIIFGHKIAKRLSKPLNLTLNSEVLSRIVRRSTTVHFIGACNAVFRCEGAGEITITYSLNQVLERLSRIVASDLGQIMGGKSQCVLNKICRGNQQEKSIHLDVSNKITVWIADILEDLSFKLLEEDLRDLEEKEGPVLDFIDDVVDNVMNICEPPPVYVDEDSDTSDSSKDGITGEESEKPITPIDSTEKNMSKLDQIYNTEEATTDATQSPTEETDDPNGSDEILTDSEHFRKEIYNLLDNINKDAGEDSEHFRKEIYNLLDNINKDAGEDSEHFRKEIYNLLDSINKDAGEDISKGSGDEIENENNEQIPPEAEMKNDENYEDTDKIDDNSEDIKQNNEHKEAIDKNDSNVSAVFDILLEDPGDDMDSKKVTFSVTGLVNPDKNTEHIITSTTEEPETDEQEQVQWNANDNTKSNIVFAEPNTHLLSDADESWPSDLTDKPWLKLSDSVSKSVTSLGRIYENDVDDKLTPPEGEDNGTNTQQMGDTKRKQAIIDELNKILPIDKNDIGSQTITALTEVYKETVTKESKTSTIKVASTEAYKETAKTESKTSTTKALEDVGKTTVSKTYEEISFDKSSKNQVNITESNIIKIPSYKSQSQIDYGWKVHPKTAPSWVTSWGQGRGEPSEDSIPIQGRPTKVRASDIRKWCKDLEKAFINLEIWSNWIDNTCKETVFILKQKEIEFPGLNRKGAANWIRLKKNIYNDAILWTKLHQRTKDNFKGLKRKYNNIDIMAAKYCAVCPCNKIKTSKT